MSAHPGQHCCYVKKRGKGKKGEPHKNPLFEIQPPNANFTTPREDYVASYTQCNSVPYGLESPVDIVRFDTWVDSKARAFSKAGEPYVDGAKIRAVQNFADGGCLFYTCAEASYRAHASGLTPIAYTALELKRFIGALIKSDPGARMLARAEMSIDPYRSGTFGESVSQSLTDDQLANYFSNASNSNRWGTSFELDIILNHLNACAYVIETHKVVGKPRFRPYIILPRRNPAFTFIILWNGAHYELGCIQPQGGGAPAPFETIWAHCGAPKFLERLYRNTYPGAAGGGCFCDGDPVNMDGIVVGAPDSIYSGSSVSTGSVSSVSSSSRSRQKTKSRDSVYDDLHGILPPELVMKVEKGTMTLDAAIDEYRKMIHPPSPRVSYSPSTSSSHSPQKIKSRDSLYDDLHDILPPHLVMKVEKGTMTLDAAIGEYSKMSHPSPRVSYSPSNSSSPRSEKSGYAWSM